MQKKYNIVKIQKMIGIILFMILLCILLSFFIFFKQTQSRYTVFKKWETQLLSSIDSVEEKIEYQDTYLKKLLEDKSFLERVVRQRLNYHKSGEIIFKFDN